MKKNISQLRAIYYTYAKKRDEKRSAFIIEREGNLNGFEKSKYKNMLYYINNKYGVKIY